jgi:hypothetical protein
LRLPGSDVGRRPLVGAVLCALIWTAAVATLLVSPAFAANGELVGFNSAATSSADELYAVNPDGSGGRALTAPAGLLTNEGVSLDADGGYGVGVGELPGLDRGLIRFEPASGTATRIGHYCDDRPALSPDGSRIAFVRLGGDECTPHPGDPPIVAGLYVMNSDGSQTQRLSWHFQRDDLAWSPDGTKLAMMSYLSSTDHPGTYDENAVVVVDVANGFESVVTPMSTGWMFGGTHGIAWSPDGTRLIVSDRAHNLQLLDAFSGSSTLIRNYGDDVTRGDFPVWAPDGQMISFWVPGEGNHVARLEATDLSCDVAVGDRVQMAGWVTGAARMPIGCHASPGDSLAVPPSGDAALLAFYGPELHYETQESFFADDASLATDNAGVSGGVSYGNGLLRRLDEHNELRLASSAPGQVIYHSLNMAVLNGSLYPWPALQGWPGSDVPDTADRLSYNIDYVRDAALMHGDPSKANHIYGRVAIDGDGKKWLQYWFYYYYNDFAFLGMGRHEGDWEGVQIGLDSSNRPDQVTFNEHERRATCAAGAYRSLASGAPKVYVGLGSHASYPAPGEWNTDVPTNDDHAHGDGPVVRPLVEAISPSATPWLNWPGRWGNSTPSETPVGDFGISPTGPAFKTSWTAPASWADEAENCMDRYDQHGTDRHSDPWWWENASESRVGQRNPLRLTMARATGRHVKVAYHIQALKRPRRGWPKIIFSLAPRTGDRPAQTITMTPARLNRDKRTAAVFDLPFEATAGRRWVVLASAVARDGSRTKIVRVTVRR